MVAEKYTPTGRQEPPEPEVAEAPSEKQGIWARLSTWTWAQPSEQDKGFINFIRPILRIHVIVFQEFLDDYIPLRASALTFIVVLSLVPVLALGTAVLKGLGAGDEMRQAAHSFIAQLESTAGSPAPPPVLPQESIIIPTDQYGSTDQGSAIPEPVESATHEGESLTDHLYTAVDFVFDYVDKTNFAALGIAGILILLFAVFSVLSSIEQTMNDIWQTSSGRSASRKLMDYLALMIIMPLTINLGVAASAILHSKTLLDMLHRWLPWLGPQLLNLLPMLAVVATFTFFYSFLPNTRVTFRAALAGGIVGGTVWLLVQALYFKLQIGVVNYNKIYGSFATLPLILLWIHISWMIFLAGAEVSFAVQVWRRYLWKKLTLTPIGHLALTFEIISTAAGDYRQKRITTRDSLVWALKQPDAYIKELLDILCEAGFMHYISNDGGGYLPAAPLTELDVLEIGTLILGELPDPLSENNPARKVLDSARKNLTGQKLLPINQI